MQAIEIKKTGGPEVLELKDIKLEDPKDGEVLIKHTAIGLNYIDTYHRSGLYPLPLPAGIGLEAAGIIEKIGKNVGDFKEGDGISDHIQGGVSLVIDVTNSGDGKSLMNAQLVRNMDSEPTTPVDQIKVKDKG